MKSPETVFPPPISLWVGNPTGFSSQSLYPVTAPCLAAVPSRSCFCRLAHEKGSSRLLLGPHSPQGPTSHFPPPARGLGQCLGRCVISPSGTPPQRPSGEWIVQAPSESFSSCLFCRAFVGMSPFPSLGTSARSPQPQVSQAQDIILMSLCSAIYLAVEPALLLAMLPEAPNFSKLYSLLTACESLGKKMCKMSETVPLLNYRVVTSVQLSVWNQQKFCTCEERQTWPGALLCNTPPWLLPTAVLPKQGKWKSLARKDHKWLVNKRKGLFCLELRNSIQS